MKNLGQTHWPSAIQVLRFFKGTPCQGVLLNYSSSFDFLAFCDSDWVACLYTKRSANGYIILLGGSSIPWKSKKQQTISLSLAEAEYISLRRVTLELSWLNRVLLKLTVSNMLHIPAKCDNLAAMYIARNPVFHECTKYLEMNHHL